MKTKIRLETLAASDIQLPQAAISSIDLPGNAASLGKPKDDLTSKIRELAYKLYEERGRKDGQELQDWLDAEAIIRHGEKVAA